MPNYQISPPLSNTQMNDLFSSAWPNHRKRDFTQLLAHSLEYVAAFSESKLIGFVNIAWDGGVHGFILDTTVHADFQRQGVGQRLLKEAEKVGKQHELEWLHVDFTPEYESFYRGAGFRPTLAGLIEL